MDSQTLRLLRIRSFERDFVKHKNEVKLLFLKRGYPERLIDNEMKKVKFNHYYFNGKYKEVKRVQYLWFYSEVQKNGGLIL